MKAKDKVDIYIVGGYVRDRLIGRECKDHDYVVVGATPEWMRAANFKQVGADFPVFLHHESGDEFALARKERKVAAGYHGFETDFDPSVTLEDDLFRRDLTINAMARKVLGWNEFGHAKLSDEIIDPFNGQEDLKNGVLRHVSEAFAEDPVRVLRAARFAARYNFTVADETLDLMKQLVRDGELNHLTPERVWAETEKALTEPYCSQYFTVLDSVGALEVIIPEIAYAIRLGTNRMLDALNVAVEEGCSIAEVFAVFATHMQPSDVEAVCDRVRAPNDVKSLAVRISRVFPPVLLGEPGDAEQIMDILESMDAFRDADATFSLYMVTRAFKDDLLIRDANIVDIASLVCQLISFDNLNETQKNTLRGPQIGKAIRDLRIAHIKRIFKKYPY